MRKREPKNDQSHPALGVSDGVPPPGDWGGHDSYAARQRLSRIVRECLEEAGVVEIEGLGVFRLDKDGRPRFEPCTRPKAFLAYATEDYPTVSRLYQALKAQGIEAWMDKFKLLPGQNWPRAIERAIRSADFFLASFSRHSVCKRGHFQAEMRFAIQTAKLLPEDDIFLIPLRLDECTVPDFIGRELQWMDLFPDWDGKVEQLAKAIRDEHRRRRLRNLQPR